MGILPKKLGDKLSRRADENALRQLVIVRGKIDFTSNDYLGLSRNQILRESTVNLLELSQPQINGATGSRLLSGNSELFEKTEKFLSDFYGSEACLIFNSGYDANLGVFSSIPQRGDLVLYDENVHASIRDGISASRANHFKFKHNDLQDLKRALDGFRERQLSHVNDTVYIVTESVFSMDGDSPDLRALTEFCSDEDCQLIVDEAHAVGIFGRNGAGLLKHLGLEEKVFARIVTFGKALGTHGAAVLGSAALREYLVNFARSFIYTTALAPHSVSAIFCAHELLQSAEGEALRKELTRLIAHFRKRLEEYSLRESFIPSESAIQSCILPGNQFVKNISKELSDLDFDVRPILSPTVSKGKERLRFSLHSFNTEEEIDGALNHIAACLKKT